MARLIPRNCRKRRKLKKKNRKFHKNDQILNQTKRNINSVCFGKISVKKRLEQNFPLIPRFRIGSMVKSENPETPGINRKPSKLKSIQC